MTTRKTSHSNESKASNDEFTGLQRLQRVMAAAGVAARRECELIIQEGRVEVDGKVVTTLGVKVDPVKQKIFVDGQRLAPERLQYFMLNKPPGVISTSNDPSGRARVIDMIKTDLRVYNVGRLDQSSEGLILVTNDGELANRLTHPRYGIEKKYHVQVDGVPTPEHLRSLVEGIYIDEGKAKATSAKILKKTEHKSWLEVVLSEGKNREIRRILAKIGHKVRVLKRVAIGPLKMGDLPVGAHRQLTFQELKELKRAAEGLVQKGKETRGPLSHKKKFPPRGPRPQSKRLIGSSRDSAPKFRPKGDGRKPKPGAVLDFDSKSKSGKRGFRPKETEAEKSGKTRFSKPERFQRPPQTKLPQTIPPQTIPPQTIPPQSKPPQSKPSQGRQRPIRESDDDSVSSKVEKFIPFDKVRSEKARPAHVRPADGPSEGARPARSENFRPQRRSEDRSTGGKDPLTGKRAENRRGTPQEKGNDGRQRERFSADGKPRSEGRKKTPGRKSFGAKQVSQIRGSEPVKSKGQRPGGDRNRSSSKRKGSAARGRQR